MKIAIAFGLTALLAGCLNQPPTPRTVDANTLTERELEQLENNIQSGVSSHITLTGYHDLGRWFQR